MAGTPLTPEELEQIRDLYGKDSFSTVYFLIFQILAGYERQSASRDLDRWGCRLPFDLDICQIILTGLPQRLCNERYGWSHEDLLRCFAFSFQPAVKKLLAEAGYEGDSYLSLFDPNKYFVTIFSPREGAEQRPAEELAGRINDGLQALYAQTLFGDRPPFSNFTVLSAPLQSYCGIAPEYAKLCRQKSYSYFIHRCMAVSQDWLAAHQRRFIHAGYNSIKKSFQDELMQNKTEHLTEYVRTLFFDYLIPSCDFFELEDLVRFLEGNMKIYSMVYQVEDRLDMSVFDYTRYDYADECCAVMCGTLEALTAGVDEKNNYSNVISNALTYISIHYAEPITINQIAADVHLSPTYLSSIVAKETGITIHDHIFNIRMANAEKLLLRTDLSVAQISQKVGYDTVKYFSKKFKEHTGQTPSAYRKRIRSVV